MDDVLQAPRTGEDDATLLATCLVHAPDGIDLAYRLLDRVAERDRVAEPSLVLHPARLGPQVFVRGGVPPTPELVTSLLSRGRGLHADGARLMPSLQPAVAASCERALDADVTGSTAGEGGMASRPSLDAAVARAAACGARYGWAVTALLLTPVGDGRTPSRWDALCRAVQAAARSGDLVGVAGPRRILALLGNVGPGVVGPFLDRVRAALGAVEGGAGAPPPGVVTAAASVPAETVDPAEVWRLLEERLHARLGGGGGTGEHWSGAVPSSLELQLRALPGVVAVGTSARGTVAGAQLTVVALDPDEGLHAAASRVVVAYFGEGAVPVVTVGARPPERPDHPANGAPTGAANGAGDGYRPATPPLGAPGEPGVAAGRESTGPVHALGLVERRAVTPGPDGAPRVALLTARFDPVTGTSEVALGSNGAHAVGRAAAGPLAGGAQATLAALGVLGVDVPFYLRSVARARELPGEPVVVVLAPRQPGGGGMGEPDPVRDRVGVAGGDGEVEAASRATLGALNRFLAGRLEHRLA